MRIVLDLEANNLLVDVTKCWIVGWKDIDTGVKVRWLDGNMGWRAELDKATVIIGHNVVGYDLQVLRKLFGWRPKKGVKVRDTMIMSQVLNYKRFPGASFHALADWGDLLGFPKFEWTDFSKYDPEMDVYWGRDLDLTEKVHTVVMKELQAIVTKNPKIVNYIRSEQAVSEWCAQAELHGWPFDKEAAIPLLAKMQAEMQVARDKILPRMGTKTVAVDKKNGIVEPKVPKWTKLGAYHASTAEYLGVHPWEGAEDIRLCDGPFSRIKIVNLDIDSVSDVKIFLFRNGWVPTEWNTKDNPEGRGKIKTSPKITEDSLECMDGDGKLYCDFLTTSSRVGILKNWLLRLDENNRLHGGCFTIGTPSMRARHSNIVNVPAAESVYGPEMRSLFTVLPGWKMVGSDSAGNQARGLAYYLKSEEYIEILLKKDIHKFNADALDTVLTGMGVSWDDYIEKHKGLASERYYAKLKAAVKAKGFTWRQYLSSKHPLAKKHAKVRRGSAKRVLYAFLFGAAGAKLWGYIFGAPDDLKGKKLKLGFTKAVPGFKALSDKLENIFGKTKQFGDGYLPGIAGNRIYCDSFHKLLVYLLQATEKATCACAVMLAMERLEAEQIPYQPLIMMHDEMDYMVPEQFAERAAVISKQAFIDGPKLMGIEIMDGESKIGDNWYDCH